MRTNGTRACLLITGVMTGCTAPQWDGTIRQWGTIREVLRDRRTEGRVLLSEAVARPHAFGIGAMESLGGEVLINDGQVWIGRAVGSTNQSTRNGTTSDESATLLAIAHVPNWIEQSVERDVSPEELDDYIATAAEAVGLDVASTFPFVIEGRLSDIAIHIVNGQCPRMAAADPAATDAAPFRMHLRAAQGTIVGFYAPDQAGVLTHHGERTHAHVLLPGDSPITGHLDAAGVQRGAIFRLPKRQTNRTSGR